MENIVIEIKSKIEQIEGDKNIIEMSTVGELFEKNGSTFVVYFESEVSGMQGCKTVLKISGETITLTRFGDTTTKMIFNRQSSMKSLYHTPYGDFDMEVKTLELDSEIVNYMEKLVEFDNMLGLIMDELDSHGQLDNTLFVIYPDHYPYMMDRDVYSDYIDIDFDSHEIMRQDLIIYATDMTGEVISMTGSTIDIAPTILNLVDSSLNFDYFMGIDLLSDTSNYVLFSDLTITDGFNYLFLNGYFIGDSSKQDILEIELTAKISQLELQKKLLIIDYFKKLKENE